MPSAKDVTPGRWTSIRVLFDDGDYSIIAGKFDNNFCLGERWNGEKGTLGFPNVFGEPVWHVVPRFLWVPMLHGVLERLSHSSPPDPKYLANAMAVLGKLTGTASEK